MANWLQLGTSSLYVNQPNLAALTVGTDGSGNWYIQYTFNGVDWQFDYANKFATQAAAQSALATYVGGLG